MHDEWSLMVTEVNIPQCGARVGIPGPGVLNTAKQLGLFFEVTLLFFSSGRGWRNCRIRGQTAGSVATLKSDIPLAIFDRLRKVGKEEHMMDFEVANPTTHSTL